jgi:hypothetical protein
VSELSDRDRIDAQIEIESQRLRVLYLGAGLHRQRARRLLAAHRRRRCVGVEDLARACEAIDAARRCLDAFALAARRIGPLLDARRNDGLATLEREIARSLDAERGS